ncbi:MAG: hypothetical protein ACKO0N_10350, partial [Planctomycetota bacterium]
GGWREVPADEGLEKNLLWVPIPNLSPASGLGTSPKKIPSPTPPPYFSHIQLLKLSKLRLGCKSPYF